MLRERLKELSSKLIDNHPFVDYGGCCVVAAHVAKHLSKHVPVRVVVGNYDDADLDEIRPNINPLDMREWEANGVGFEHVLVEFKENGRWYTFDSTHGVKRRAEFWGSYCFCEKAEGCLTIKEATALASSGYGWNSTFDRHEIPTIRRRIGRFFGRLH